MLMKTKLLFLLVIVAMCWTTAMAQLTVKGKVVPQCYSGVTSPDAGSVFHPSPKVS